MISGLADPKQAQLAMDNVHARLNTGYGQFTEGKASPHAGRSHVHWLTGTASTVMVGCVEGILGMRPDLGASK